MIRLLNSAVIPRSGVYTAKKISSEEFSSIVRGSLDSQVPVVSYIGYPVTADIIEQLTGWKPPISRASTDVEDGDILLVCRLKYRVSDPSKKSEEVPTIDDMEFFKIFYEAY